jgi:hypothetical protein
MENEVSSEIAIAGITYQQKWYRGPLKSIKHTDKIRGDLILYAIKFATGVGHKIVIVDGGSSKTFISELKKIPGAKIFQSKIPKRSPNRRKAIFEASKIPGIKAIVMTEIEKVSLITDCMREIVEPILNGDADLVVPKREEELFKKTYPDYMFESEVEGNLFYCEALRASGLLSSHMDELDVFFGARVFRNDKKLLKFLLSHYEANPFNSLLEHKLFDLEEYSNAQFFPVVKALSKGKKVVSVTVPFKYPERQKENEEKGDREYFILKRRFQRLTIIIELMHFLGYLGNKKARKITTT